MQRASVNSRTWRRCRRRPTDVAASSLAALLGGAVVVCAKFGPQPGRSFGVGAAPRPPRPSYTGAAARRTWGGPTHGLLGSRSDTVPALSALGVEAVYSTGLALAAAVAGGLAVRVRPWDPQGEEEIDGEPGSPVETKPDSRELAALFLPVWCLCVAGDWLQGPYVYALYEAYGLPRSDIARLFVAGFGASMACGTVVGSWVDRLGRKRGCQLYCLLYILSCLTKHFGNFWALLLGRFTGGMATSLLFSAFEAWLIRQHAVRHGASPEGSTGPGLRRLFGLMWFASSAVAIAAGPAGDVFVGLQPLTDSGVAAFHYGGLTAAFDLAGVVLLAGLALLTQTWAENYGGDAAEVEGGAPAAITGTTADQPFALLSSGVQAIVASPALLALMVVVAAFEASMYAFVFNWTPSLTDWATTPPDLGSVFATLMLAYMFGSLFFQVLGQVPSGPTGAAMPVLSLTALRLALALAPLALGSAALALRGAPVEGDGAGRTAWVLGSFVLFEFCCGLYAPAVSAVKGALVPEGIRTTVYSTFRAPMNALVLVVLLADLSTDTALAVCAGLLVVAALASIPLALPPPEPERGT